MKTNDKSSSVVPDFQDFTWINSKLLRGMGMVVGTDGNKRDRRSRILERVPTTAINIVCIMDSVFQMHWISDIWKTDKKLVLQIATNTLSNIVCVCKGFRLAYCREDLQMIFENLAINWRERIPDHEIREEILREAQKTLIFCRCYLSMILVLGLCFGLPPLKYFLLVFIDRNPTNRTYDYTERIFLVRYPFNINTPSIYSAVFLEELGVLYAAAIHWMCCDTLFVQLTSHISLQLKLLHHDIETAANHENNEGLFKRNVINIVRRHQELLSVCDMIENVFSPILFTIMLLTAVNMCVNLFELREMVLEAQYIGAVLHSFHLINVVFQLLVYCVYAETLTGQAGSIADAAYNCKWTEKNHKLRIYFQILIMKSQKPLYCTAYGFFPIDHQRITAIFRTAMSYYMMIHQTTS